METPEGMGEKQKTKEKKSGEPGPTWSD